MKTLAILFALTITAQPLVNEDVLEPSVRNEVDHALSRVPTNAPTAVANADCSFGHLFCTNGLSATALAVRLVSAQRSDGRWLVVRDGLTNDVTAAAVRLLKGCLE